MKPLLVLFTALLINSASVLCDLSEKRIKFWQLTDIHFDNMYSEKGGNLGKQCHYSPVTAAKVLGKFGEFACEANWGLIQSAVEAMKVIIKF